MNTFPYLTKQSRPKRKYALSGSLLIQEMEVRRVSHQINKKKNAPKNIKKEYEQWDIL